MKQSVSVSGSRRPSNARIANAVRSISSIEVATLCAIAIVGLLQIPTPFYGDQALFALGASSISHGAVLYRDFWDLKQPGIFWFYAVAGNIFDFDAVGIHIFELLYELAFGAVLIATLRRRFSEPAFACLAALFTIGSFYAYADGWDLTQVEWLAGFPLYLTFWFALAAARARSRNQVLMFAALAGAGGAFVVLLKFMFLPLVVAACWLPAALALRAQGNAVARRAALQSAAALTAGFGLPLLLCAAYFTSQHALPIALQTTFDIPRRIFAAVPPQPWSTLAASIRWFVRGFAPIVVLAAVGAAVWLRARRDSLTTGLLVWVGCGIAIFLAQHQSWWSYQTILVLPPLGILAAAGAERLWQTTWFRRCPARRRAIAFAAAGILLFCLPLHAAAKRAGTLARYGFAVRPAQRELYERAVSPSLRVAYESSRYLMQLQRTPGAIYVCGDPLIYTLTGRHQAVAINGWLLELLLPEQWRELAAQLRAAAPPYIFVSREYAPPGGPSLIDRRSPDMRRILATRYHAVRHDAGGTWYERS